MAHRLSWTVVAPALVLATWVLISGVAFAVGPYNPAGYGDVAYGPPGYYVPADGGAAATAALYPCPRPTPPLVGHTYITYQPLAPHEFLYEHHRVYVSCNPCSGPTRTSVKWSHDRILWPFTPSLRWQLPAVPTVATPSTGCAP